MRILLCSSDTETLLKKLKDTDDEELKQIHNRLAEAAKDEETLAEDFKKYRKVAHDTYHADGFTEIDDGAIVSPGDDPGAYVMAWVWVDAVDAGVMTAEEWDKLQEST